MNKKQLLYITWFLVIIIALLVITGIVLIILSKPPSHLSKSSSLSSSLSSSQSSSNVDKPTVIIVKTDTPTPDNRATVYPKQYLDSEFTQVGLLVSDESPPMIIPLFARQLKYRNNRWKYYAAADKNPLWKIPISKGNRNCMEDDVGCDEIYDGEDVIVPIYQDKKFKATVYKKQLHNPFALD